jgi:hypothetical protein
MLPSPISVEARWPFHCGLGQGNRFLHTKKREPIIGSDSSGRSAVTNAIPIAATSRNATMHGPHRVRVLWAGVEPADNLTVAERLDGKPDEGHDRHTRPRAHGIAA